MIICRSAYQMRVLEFRKWIWKKYLSVFIGYRVSLLPIQVQVSVYSFAQKLLRLMEVKYGHRVNWALGQLFLFAFLPKENNNSLCLYINSLQSLFYFLMVLLFQDSPCIYLNIGCVNPSIRPGVFTNFFGYLCNTF